MQSVVEQLLHDACRKVNCLQFRKDEVSIEVTHPKNKSHGDFTTNLALILARTTSMLPIQLAALIVQALPEHAQLKCVKIAEPGFINFFMQPLDRSYVMTTILQRKIELHLLDGDNEVQYASARIQSLFRQLEQHGLNWDQDKGLLAIDMLSNPLEIVLIEQLSQAINGHFSAHELATNLHEYFNVTTFLCEDEALRCARLCLLKAIEQILDHTDRQGVRCITPESM